MKFRNWFLAALLFGGAVQADPVDFSLPDIEGKVRTLSEFRGKWVVVNYWATWCPPCLEEIPDLVSFHDRHQDTDAVVIGINFEDIPQDQLRAFVDDYFITYPVLRNGDMAPPTERLDVGGLPTTYIISPEGVPVARQVGTVTAGALEKFIEKENLDRAANKQSLRNPARLEARP